MFRNAQNNAIVHLAMVMWRNAIGNRGKIVLYVSLACIAILIELCVPYVIAQVLNAVQTLSGEELLERVALLMGVYVALGILIWAFHGPSRVIEMITAFVVKRSLQTGLFRRVNLMPTSWHQEHHSGETIDQIAKATQALDEFTNGGFEVIHLLTRFVGATIVLTWIMPSAGLAVLVSGTAAIFVIVLFDRKLIAQYHKLNKRFNEVAATVQDYLTNVATIISLRLEGRVTSEVDKQMGEILPLHKNNAVFNELKWFSTNLIVDVTLASVIFAYVFLKVRAGEVIEIGTMYALTEYLRAIGISFFQFTGKYGDLVVKSTRVHATDHIYESFLREGKTSEPGGLPKDWKVTRIRGLSYLHGDESNYGYNPGVRNIDLTLERGKSYAFVGESGCGKSTTLKLIRGTYPARTGQVICDFVRQPLGVAGLAPNVTLIPQEPEIFSASIWFNITMGLPATEEEVLEVIELARFTEKLARLPNGLQTNVAEKGVSLSGGERQRLALARGIFFAERSESDIILLDEATSSLDSQNELAIYKALIARYQDRCLVSAIHKLHLLELFDEVVVFDRGQIVERGTFAQLQGNGGNLASMWNCYNKEEEPLMVSF